MAFPVDADRVANNITTAVDPWELNYPTHNDGDLLIVYSRQNNVVDSGNIGSTDTVNWTSLIFDINDGSGDRHWLHWGISDATLSSGSPATIRFDWNTTAHKGCSIIWRITGHDPNTPPTSSPIASQTTHFTTADADPPTHTPAGGAKDFLWIVGISLDGETQTFTVPSGYGNQISANSGTGGSAATNSRMSGCSRTNNAASENPGTWTHAAPSSGGGTFTMCVFPDPGSGGGGEEFPIEGGRYYPMEKWKGIFVPERWHDKIWVPGIPDVVYQ